MSKAPRTSVLVLAVVAIAIAAFVPALAGGWIYDDHTLIADNPHAHSLSEWHSWVSQDFWHADADAVYAPPAIRYWRPVISASYAVDWTIGGGSPLWFHAMNLVLHGAVAALAFLTLRRWIGGDIPAAIATALFCVHPTKAESVAWIAGRTDIICMLAILVAIAGVARRLRGERGGKTLEILGTVAAYMSKEQAIVLPIFVLVEVWLHAGRAAIDLPFGKRAIRAVAPHVAIAVAYLVVRAIWLPLRSDTSVSLPLLDHLLVILETMGRYIALVVAPVRLTIQQDLSYAAGGAPHAMGYVALGALGTLGLTATAWLCRVKAPFVTLGIAVFGITIAPTSNLAYTGMYTILSERFLYIPLIGLAWIAGEAAARSRTVRIVIIVATVAFAARSWVRAADYVDESSFWARELTINPNSREAHQYRFMDAMNEMRYRAGLAELVSYVKTADSSVDLEAIARVAETAALLTPDANTHDLAAIDAFVADVIAQQPTATLAVAGIDLAIAPRTVAKGLTTRGYRLVVIRANIASRLGDQPRALALAEAASTQCRGCSSTLVAEALVHARMGDFTTARAVLARGNGTGAEAPLAAARAMIDDAAAHQAHASNGGLWEQAEALASLEAWGAAFALVAPQEAQLTTTPDHAVRFAELAFRAGYADRARTILARTGGVAVEETLSGWAAGMGWRE